MAQFDGEYTYIAELDEFRLVSDGGVSLSQKNVNAFGQKWVIEKVGVEVILISTTDQYLDNTWFLFNSRTETRLVDIAPQSSCTSSCSAGIKRLLFFFEK